MRSRISFFLTLLSAGGCAADHASMPPPLDQSPELPAAVAPPRGSIPSPHLRVQTVFIGTDYDARGTVKGHRIRTFIDVPDPVPEDTSLTWTHFGPYWDHYGSSLADGGPDPRTFVLVRDSRRCPVTTLRKVYVRAENERTAAIEVDASACRPADLHGYAEEVP